MYQNNKWFYWLYIYNIQVENVCMIQMWHIDDRFLLYLQGLAGSVNVFKIFF